MFNELIDDLILNNLNDYQRLFKYKKHDYSKLLDYIEHNFNNFSADTKLKVLNILTFIIKIKRDIKLDYLESILTVEPNKYLNLLILTIQRKNTKQIISTIKSKLLDLKLVISTTNPTSNEPTPKITEPTPFDNIHEVSDTNASGIRNGSDGSRLESEEKERKNKELLMMINCLLCTIEEQCEIIAKGNYIQLLVEEAKQINEFSSLALATLDQISKYKSKFQEVLLQTQANVNHGFLIQTLSKIFTLPVDYAEQFIQLVYDFCGVPNGANTLIPAGIVPVLMDLLVLKDNKQWKTQTKILQLLDNMIYSFELVGTFITLGGLTKLADLLDYHVKMVFQFKDLVDDRLLQMYYEGNMDRFNELLEHIIPRGILKLILHMVQNNGSSDGLRNIIESPIIKTLALIIEHSELFGVIGAYSLALNIFSFIIHNEPTSLSILQEMGITKSILQSIHRGCVKNSETISAIPNVMGAICLNEKGVAEYLANDPAPKFMRMLVGDIDGLVENDLGYLAGACIDEIIRHQPAVKETMYAAIMQLVNMVPKEVEKMKIKPEDGIRLLQNGPVPKERVDSDRIVQLELFLRFMEGLFQNTAHASIFLEKGGLQILLDLVHSENGVDFGDSPGHLSFGYCCRSMIEVKSNEVIKALQQEFIKSIKAVTISEEMKGCARAFLGLDDTTKYTSMNKGIGEDMPAESVAKRDATVASLVVIKNMIKLMQDLFCTHWLASGKSIQCVVDLFSHTSILADLVRIGAFLNVESETVARVVPIDWHDNERDGSELTDEQKQYCQKIGINFNLNDDFLKWNTGLLMHVFMELPEDCCELVSALQRTICSKKVLPTMQKGIDEVLDQFSVILREGFNSRDIESAAFCTKIARALLLEPKSGVVVVQTMQLQNLQKSGGFQLFLEYFKWLIDQLMSTKCENEDNGSDIELNRKHSLAQKAVEKILEIFEVLVSDKRFHDSPYTSALYNRTREVNSPDYFDTINFFLTLRKDIFTILLDVFKNYIVDLEAGSQKSITKTLLSILEGNGEVRREPRQETMGSLLNAFAQELQVRARVPIVPEESGIQVLIEMGFPRAAASRALSVHRNNVSRAADYLLNNPGIVIQAEAEARTAETVAEPTVEPVESSPTEQATLPNLVPIENNEEDGESGLSENDSDYEDIDDSMDVVENDTEPIQPASNIKMELSKQRAEASQEISDHALAIFPLLDSSTLLNIKSILCVIHKENIIVLVEKLILILKENKMDYMPLFATIVCDPVFQQKIFESNIVDYEYLLMLTENIVEIDEWNSSLLLVHESYLNANEAVPKETLDLQNGEYKPIERPVVPKANIAQLKTLTKHMIEMLKLPEVDDDTLNSIFRILVRVTRNHEVAFYFLEQGGVPLLFSAEVLGRFAIQHPLTMVILRHICDSREILSTLMEFEIQKFMNSPRPKTIEILNFIKGIGYSILRENTVFMEAIKNCCELSKFQMESPFFLECIKKDLVNDGGHLNVNIQGPGQLVEYFVTEIFAFKSQVASENEIILAQQHLVFNSFLQCLSELVMIYPRCKVDLIAFTARKNKHSTTRTSKNPFILYLLHEILPKSYVGADNRSELQKSFDIKDSKWAMILISSLCTIRTEFVDSRFNAQIDFVHSCVADCIYKAIKDTANLEDNPFKQNKLQALFDLLNRILTIQRQISPSDKDDKESASLKLAKMLIDKGFVELLTNISADLDASTEKSTAAIEALLKPIGVISTAAIYLGKNELTAPLKNPNFENAFEEVEDEGMIEDHPDLTDLYRNSSLGILEPAMQSEDDTDDSSGIDGYSDDEEDESEDLSESEDEMEIVIPQPFHGNEPLVHSDSENFIEVDEESGEDIEEGSLDWEDMEDEHDDSGPGDENGISPANFAQLMRQNNQEPSSNANRDTIMEEDVTSDEESDESELFETNFHTNRVNRNIADHIPIGTGSDLQALFGMPSSNFTLPDLEELPLQVNLIQRNMGNDEFVHPALRDNQSNLVAPSQMLSGNNRRTIQEMAMQTVDYFERMIFPTASRQRAQERRDLRSRIFGGTPKQTVTPPKKETNFPEDLQKQISNIHLGKIGFTEERWKQESRIIFGHLTVEAALSFSNSIINALLPNAVEKYKVKIQEEEEARLKKENEEKARKEVANEPNASDVEIPPAEQGESESNNRQTVVIDGVEIDVTGSGIDVTFLEALPDELRQEVINQHFQDQMFAQRNVENNSNLNPDFLAALPIEMRREVLDQVGRESQVADEMENLTVTNNLQNQHIRKKTDPKENGNSKKESVILLNYTGLAKLLRLLFVLEPKSHDILELIFANVCENSKSRSEFLGLLLSILTGDGQNLGVVDKNFSQLTIRDIVSGDKADPELLATTIAQRCLIALYSVTRNVSSVGKYFLTEIEGVSGKTPKSLKKGKSKNSAATYPFVILLNLLENPSFLHNSNVLEPLINLLSTVLRPLSHIAKKKYSIRESASSKREEVSLTAGNVEPTEFRTPKKSLVNVPDQTPMRDRADVRLPHIPERSIKSVLNILKDSNSSSKTFQFTLTIIQYLSSYPENLNILTRELINIAKEFGELVEKDVALLEDNLKSVKSNEPMNSDFLNNFTSTVAPQIKLLRILKTFEFLFNSKDHGVKLLPAYLDALPIDESLKIKISAMDKTNIQDSKADMEVLQDFYEQLNFSSLWKKLGDCISIIGVRDDLIHVATVILPIIESYMVVSRPSVILKKSQVPLPILPRVSLMQPSEIAEADMDDFGQFAEKNKKVLNTMVRNNPALMNGSFSLLVESPKVLQFDNKRTYFNSELHKKSKYNSFGQININVRRKFVFEESYQQLQGRAGDDIKYGRLNVRFRDEEGVDAGGVTREWFSALALQMFNPNYALFLPTATDKVTYQPNRASGINPDHLFYFKFVGRIIGKAIFDGKLLDAYFTRSFYKCMINAPVDHRDLEPIEPEFFKSLDWMLNNNITDVLDLTYSMEVEEFGIQKIIDLKPGGRNIPVTDENKHEYVRLVVEQKLVVAIKSQIEAFLSGFNEIIPANLIRIFNEQELELLISGLPDIDIDDWRNNSEYQNYSASSQQIQWFWRAVRSFSQEERAKLLQFTTGTSKVPLGGFAKLNGSTGIQKFQIHKEFSSSNRLPSAHTCFNQIDLPQYESYEQLRSSLLLAISECGTGFGFA